ncbi:Hypothetical predicted protein [Pelobates cultripes]|uniref:Uncharacterized protein n=1 Tax=Pelobates cultripes TaxID=61616 RepID=A0AAD1VQJ5_PELCU|nr:Hypothetical predicted protein [Pelobates cultripes]
MEMHPPTIYLSPEKKRNPIHVPHTPSTPRRQQAHRRASKRSSSATTNFGTLCHDLGHKPQRQQRRDGTRRRRPTLSGANHPRPRMQRAQPEPICV